MRLETVKQEVERYRHECGGVAFIYPRRREIAINGFPAVPFSEAVQKMRAMRARRRAQEQRHTATAEAMHGATVRVGDRVAVAMHPARVGTVTEVHALPPEADSDDWCLIQYDDGAVEPSGAWCLEVVG